MHGTPFFGVVSVLLYHYCRHSHFQDLVSVSSGCSQSGMESGNCEVPHKPWINLITLLSLRYIRLSKTLNLCTSIPKTHSTICLALLSVIVYSLVLR